jgi:hypothetical protein
MKPATTLDMWGFVSYLTLPRDAAVRLDDLADVSMLLPTLATNDQVQPRPPADPTIVADERGRRLQSLVRRLLWKADDVYVGSLCLKVTDTAIGDADTRQHHPADVRERDKLLQSLVCDLRFPKVDRPKFG